MAKVSDDSVYPVLAVLSSGAKIVIFDPASGDPLNKVLPDAVQQFLNLNSIPGTLSILKGGTGNTTQQSGFNALSPVTTAGDLIVRDGSNNIRLPVGSIGQILIADPAQPEKMKWDDQPPVPPALFVSTDDATVENSATDDTIIGPVEGTKIIPQNTLVQGSTFSLFAYGTLQTNGVSQTIQITVRLGSAIIAQTRVIPLPNLTSPQPCEIEIENITFRAGGGPATAICQSGGDFVYRQSSAGNVPQREIMSLKNSTTIDTTVDNTLDVTVLWGAASASNTITFSTMSFLRTK